jgi:putative tricarboxylic transport membrane protein
MRVRHLLTAGVPMALGAFAIVASLQLGVGTLTAPSAGMWPLVASVVLVLGSLAVLLSPAEDGDPFTSTSRHILVVLAALAVFVVLFVQFGFVLPAVLLLVFWLRWVSNESWTMTLLVAVGATGVLYVLFDVALGVPFPYDLVTGR